MPPSTTSSHTMSAEFSPVCGRASREFSILTASAGRSTGAAMRTPVSGHRGGGGGGGGGAADVVGAGVLLIAAGVFWWWLQPAVASTAAAISATPSRRRRLRTWSLPVPPDYVLDSTSGPVPVGTW